MNCDAIIIIIMIIYYLAIIVLMLIRRLHLVLQSYFYCAFIATKRPKHYANAYIKPELSRTFCQSQVETPTQRENPARFTTIPLSFTNNIYCTMMRQINKILSVAKWLCW